MGNQRQQSKNFRLLNQLKKLSIDASVEKSTILNQINQAINSAEYQIEDFAPEKPWGAYWRFSNSQAEKFINEFFNIGINEVTAGNNKIELSPKILLAAPNQRLSWQYHFRRSEFWRSIIGPASYVRSETDQESQPEIFPSGSIIKFQEMERHRLISGDGWSLVAEIWKHLDDNNLSDEADIVRLQDDYQR